MALARQCLNDFILAATAEEPSVLYEQHRMPCCTAQFDERAQGARRRCDSQANPVGRPGFILADVAEDTSKWGERAATKASRMGVSSSTIRIASWGGAAFESAGYMAFEIVFGLVVCKSNHLHRN